MRAPNHAIQCTVLTITIFGSFALAQEPTSKPSSGSGISQIPATQPALKLYQNQQLGFSIMLPDGWKLSEKRFTHSHYTTVFLTVNSMRGDLQVLDKVTARDANGGPTELQFSPKTTLEQMMPGEVYLSIAFADGPGNPTVQADTVAADLRSILTKTAISVSAEPRLSELELSFFKQAHRWAIHVYLREPITPEDRQKVMSLLESWRFIDVPVKNAR